MQQPLALSLFLVNQNTNVILFAMFTDIEKSQNCLKQNR